MGLKEAELAMAALESSTSEFDSEKYNFYRTKMREYVSLKKEMYGEQPVLFDVTRGKTELPEHLTERIDNWMTKNPRYFPVMRYFAKYYLLSLLSDGPSSKLYVPLAESVFEGCNFYLETGFFCLEDGWSVSSLQF